MGWHSAGSWHGQLAAAGTGSSRSSGSSSSGAIPGAPLRGQARRRQSMSDELDMLLRHRVASRILRPGGARPDAPQAVGAGLRGREAVALGRGLGWVTAVWMKVESQL